MMNLHLLHRIMIYAAVRGAAYGCNKEAHTCPPIPGCTGMIDKIDSYRITAWEVTLDGNPLEISDGRITVRDDSNGMMNAVTLLCEAVRNGDFRGRRRRLRCEAIRIFFPGLALCRRSRKIFPSRHSRRRLYPHRIRRFRPARTAPGFRLRHRGEVHHRRQGTVSSDYGNSALTPSLGYGCPQLAGRKTDAPPPAAFAAHRPPSFRSSRPSKARGTIPSALAARRVRVAQPMHPGRFAMPATKRGHTKAGERQSVPLLLSVSDRRTYRLPAMNSSISCTVTGMRRLPRMRLPVSVMSRSSSIRIPPKFMYGSSLSKLTNSLFVPSAFHLAM